MILPSPLFMASKNVDIANRALSLVGSPIISSLEDGSREATLIKTVYDDTRLVCLRLHPWKFATTRAVLNTSLEEPVCDFAYTYQLPADFVRMIIVDDGRTEYDLQGNTILTDSESINVRYVRDEDNVEIFDTLFVELFAHWLAWVICLPLTQSKDMKDSIWAALSRMTPSFKHVDSADNYQKTLVTETWLGARNYPASGFVRDPMT